MSKNNLYQSLVEKLEEISHLNGVMSTMGWDQEVMMPAGAAQARSKQIATLAGIIHERMTHPSLGECLEMLQEKCNQENAIERCNILEARRQYDLMTRIPKRLVQALAELGSRGQTTWVQARRDNTFDSFAPVIQEFLTLKKEWASCAFPEMQPYDANLDLFERGTTSAEVSVIFDQLKTALIPLIDSIRGHDYQPDTSFLKGYFAIDKQAELARIISKDIGFDFQKGRMDVSVHPFCGGSHPTDVRITTRYTELDFIESLYAAIHETGHALYEQGRMPGYEDLPVSESLTMGIHESQSLFWERMIGQSRVFCAHYFELISKTFPDNFQNKTADSLYQAVNACQPGLIRVEADELTYPLHVILRFEIEKDLFEDKIAVEDLPAVWNEKMVSYLGISPPNDSLGVLQDSHWSAGAFGYFPSYTLGAIYACQFYAAAQKDLGDIESKITAGEFAPIKHWLNEKIHSQGRLYTPRELVLRITGEPLNGMRLIEYLEAKYGELYRLNGKGISA
ncbi:carboxypeptidase Taq [Nitrosomonas marina]|uniref:Metal-dependent carboxypeptidase n=1 Tax=Nitrosomonas marina TaxID=917 RepID=A0A1H9YXY0_9PROT|nr:carboxypeptidase M32 [Nitrosomonas marina]SES74068.1 carboxypeptidase Taq [Nitrosomonas marina]